MRINQKVRYAVVCLHELAKNQGCYLSSDEIAQKRQMPSAYIQKILRRLAANGLVESQKGAGYRLAVPLSQITAFQLVQTLSDAEDVAQGQGSDIPDQFQRHFERALKSFSLAELTV